MSKLPDVKFNMAAQDACRKVAARDKVRLLFRSKSVKWTYGPHTFTLTLSTKAADKDYVRDGYTQFRARTTYMVGDQKKVAHDATWVNRRGATAEVWADAYEASKLVPPYVQDALFDHEEHEKPKEY